MNRMYPRLVRIILCALTLVVCAPLIGAYAARETEEKAEQSLCAEAKDEGFSIGAAFSYYQLWDQSYIRLIQKHFNSITPTNELKAYSLLDERASKRSADGMPVMRYDSADAMLAFARDNNIGVRGHVLVWDAYMCDWFFREGYDTARPYEDADTIKQRLKSYITQVLTHFESEFPGVIYCWDVVNEAVGDGAGEYLASDPRHVRTVRNGASNPFYTCVGADYVELSFLYARDALDALNSDVKLFYNDYNAFMTEKRDAICALIDSINAYAKDENGNACKLLDGVGMQGYIGGYGKQAGCMNDADLKRIKTAIEIYAAKELEVQITEMAVRNFQNDDASVAKHAAFYEKLFKLFKSINRKNEAKPLTNISIWGLLDTPDAAQDSYGYRMNGLYSGLFDQNCAEKLAYANVLAVLMAE